MNRTTHHHVGVNVPGKTFSRFIERALKDIRRSPRLKDSLTIIPTIDPMVESTGKFNA